MTSDPRVQRLLEELLDSGRTPEEVCDTCPELLPLVRNRWRRLRAVDAQVGVLFPTLEPAQAVKVPGELPHIPGYEVLGELGRGGMGIVYKAQHLGLNRAVALKMLLAGPYARPEERARFQREAEAVAALRHPNIVQVHDVGEHDGRPYFTLEFVEGGSLAQKLAGAPLPARQAAALAATLAEAVEAAHRGGIVHRDLKPANVLLTVDGTPKVTDFGVARRLGDGAALTQTGVAVGTPSYMAPEQARGGPDALGPTADVYALGAILYELLTGRPPFQAATAAATFRLVLDEEPAPPARRNPQVPRDLDTICLKCLQKERGKRYPTAADLAADLARFLNHEPIQARPPGRLERGLLWIRRRPASAALLAAGALLVAAGAVVACLLYQQQTAAHSRQVQTDQEVRAIVAQARGRLEKSWAAADLATVTEAVAAGRRAEDIARSGGAGSAVWQEVQAFRVDAGAWLGRARKNRSLQEALLDVSFAHEAKTYTLDKAARGLVLSLASLEEQYAAAFRRWGVDVDGTAEAEVVRRLGAEPDPVVQEVIAALDHWMLERRAQGRPEAEWGRLVRVADQLDRSARHRQLRALLVTLPPRPARGVAAAATSELARGRARRQLWEMRQQINPRTEPALTVVLLARAFDAAGDAVGAERLLREAVTARPDQVVLLVALGVLLEAQGPSRRADAIGYYRTARSHRPQLGLALCNALLSAGRSVEAAELTRELLRQQPGQPWASYYFSFAVYLQGNLSAAEAAVRKAIELNPDFVEAHFNLGCILAKQGKFGAAETAFRKVIELTPDFPEAHGNLGRMLDYQGKPAAAAAAFRKAIDLKPDLAEAHNTLGLALTARSQPDAAAAFRRAIDLKPAFAEAHNNLGNTLLLQGQYAAAAAAFRKAGDLNPDFAEAYHGLGMALLQQQKPGAAEAAFRKLIDRKPDAGLACYYLGVALMQQARFDEAAASLKKADDWLPARHPRREQARQLRQQCQRYALLDARLPELRQGTAKPANVGEHLEFARLCHLKKLHATAAGLYAEAFAREPNWAEEPRTGHRYKAACSAALGGCGQGEEMVGLDDAGRARWRRRALEWLRADLGAWVRWLDGDPTARDVVVHKVLVHWRANPELACVRDAAALDRLAPDERREYRALWAEVAAVLGRTGK